MKKTKVLIATGGTGGHVFPAQALAQELLKQKIAEELLFAGQGLGTNRYFQRELFPFKEISSATPFKGGIFKIFKTALSISRGILSSIKIISSFKPDVVIGFGSFHSFPVLAAAWIKKIPIVLFESNSVPGKVNKLFSRRAALTGVQFPEAESHLFGPTALVEMPLWKQDHFASYDFSQARDYFGLSSSLSTLLVFGGSQGAVSINRLFCAAVRAMSKADLPFQVIHITGSENDVDEIAQTYNSLNVPSCVKKFEDKMPLAWKAADLAVCRSGAATLSELIFYQVPSILIPFPHAADNHQQKNAEFMQTAVGGAIMIPEHALDAERLAIEIQSGLLRQKEMQANIQKFKRGEGRKSLTSLITEIISHEHR